MFDPCDPCHIYNRIVYAARTHPYLQGISNKPKISLIQSHLHEIYPKYYSKLIRLYLLQITSDKADLKLVRKP